jgi:hypothetical protein
VAVHLIVAIAAVLVGVSIPVGATSSGLTVQADFERRGPDEVSPSGQSVFGDCQVDGIKEPEGWHDAAATLRINQADGESRVRIVVTDARPNTFYTVWLRLGGSDSNGDRFGGNPVTGGQATPLAHTSMLPTLLATTGVGNGSSRQPNGFYTNDRGNATFTTTVDFPVVGGAYPWQRFPNWDPTDPRLPADDPAIHPVAIAGPQGP